MRPLSPREKAIKKLAERGGGDSDLLILDEIHRLEDKFDETVSQIKEDVPDLDKVMESVRGEKGKDGKDGEKGDKGDKPSRRELVEIMLPLIPDPIPGKDGKTPSEKELKEIIIPLIPEPIPGPMGPESTVPGPAGKDGSPDTGDEIIEKINNDATLLISREAIEGLDALEKQIMEKTGNTTRIGWGAHPLGIQSVGVTIDKNVRFIDFRGAGISSVTRNASGVVVVTIGAGSGAVIEAPTGTVNAVNTVFTPSAEPDYVVADGITYFDGAGYTWNGTTITMDIAPSQYIRAAV